MRKHLSLMVISANSQIKSLSMTLVRSVFLIVVLTIFYQVWKVLKADITTEYGFTPVDFVWYLLIGEMIMFGIPEGMVQDVEEDVRTGNIGYFLMKPVSYLSMKFWQSLGVFIVRVPILLLIGGSWIFLMTGNLPAGILHLPLIILLLLLSASFSILSNISIGMTALFLQTADPVEWLFYKLWWIFGGLFFPIMFYPEWLYKIAMLTPFGWIGYGVSSLIYDFSYSRAFEVAWHIGLWLSIAVVILSILYKSLLKKVSVNGG